MKYKAIGWTRHGKPEDGYVSKYHLKDVCNCITTFCGGGISNKKTGMGNTTPYILVEYD